MNDRIRMMIEDGVADVRLTRPDKLNALDPAVFKALEESGGALKQNQSLRAVVISGEGRAFCAGLDVERMKALAAGESLIPSVDLTRRSHGLAKTQSWPGQPCAARRLAMARASRTRDCGHAWDCVRRRLPVGLGHGRAFCPSQHALFDPRDEVGPSA
jgi:enoyl-CoA hydratase/carnithine racemase